MNNIVEGSSVKSEEFAISFGFNGGGSWGIVHEGKFSEKLSRFVGLQVGLRSVDDLVAVELSALNNKKSVSLLSLNDDVLASRGLDLCHGVDDDVQIFLIEVAEEDASLDEIPDISLGLITFGNDAGDELGLFVELTKDLGADPLPAVFFINLLFLLGLKFSQELSLFFLVLLVGVRLKSSVILVV